MKNPTRYRHTGLKIFSVTEGLGPCLDHSEEAPVKLLKLSVFELRRDRHWIYVNLALFKYFLQKIINGLKRKGQRGAVMFYVMLASVGF